MLHMEIDSKYYFYCFYSSYQPFSNLIPQDLKLNQSQVGISMFLVNLDKEQNRTHTNNMSHISG